MSPVIIPEKLPATEQLQLENIFVMNESRASIQDIRPLKVLIVNLMPTKIVTETQILRLLGNHLIQVELTFAHMDSYESKNTPKSHLNQFYTTFSSISHLQFDAMIITGAPVEHLHFEEVDYWNEFTKILDWAKRNVFASLFICWSSQAALYHYYQIDKVTLPKKIFGVFPHHVHNKTSRLMRGFDEIFYAPQSRYTSVDIDALLNTPELEVLASSIEAGPHIITSKDRKFVFVTGHPEYDADTLKLEYDRDVEKGIEIAVPANYFKNDDPNNEILVTWRAHANLLYGNWINYYVYQETEYDLTKIGQTPVPYGDGI